MTSCQLVNICLSSVKPLVKLREKKPNIDRSIYKRHSDDLIPFKSVLKCLLPGKTPPLRCDDPILRRSSPADTWVTSECHCCGETPRRGLNSSVRTSASPSSARPPSALMSPLALVSAIRDGKRNNFIPGVDEVNCLVDVHLALSC